VLCLKQSHHLPTLTLQIPTHHPTPLKILLGKAQLTIFVVLLADVLPEHLPVQEVDPGTVVVLRYGRFLDLGHRLDALQQSLWLVVEVVGLDPLP